MKYKYLFLIIFLFVPFLAFSQTEKLNTQTQFTDMAGKQIFKIKVLGLQPEQNAILNIGIYSDAHKINPMLVAQKLISYNDLDANGYYTYTSNQFLPQGVFKGISSIKLSQSSNQGESSADKAKFLINTDVSSLPFSKDSYKENCTNNVCFSLETMNYDHIAIRFKIEADDVVNFGIDCVPVGSVMLENVAYSQNGIEAGAKGSPSLGLRKKYPEKDYICNPYIITTGFLGLRKEIKGNKFLYPAYPYIKTEVYSYSAGNVSVSGDIADGNQEYYPSYVIKKGEFNGSGDTYCLVEKKQYAGSYFISTTFNPMLIKAYRCNKWMFPISDMPKNLKMEDGQVYNIGIIAKGVSNELIMGNTKENFIRYVYDAKKIGQAPKEDLIPLKINSVTYQKDPTNKVVYIKVNMPEGQSILNDYFYIKEYGKTSGSIIINGYFYSPKAPNSKNVVINGFVYYPETYVFGKDQQTTETLTFSNKKKYIFGYCAKNSTSNICKETSIFTLDGMNNAPIPRAQYISDGKCTTNIDDGKITLERAKQITETVSKIVNVRKELLMAILMQETNLGTNTGECTFNQNDRYCVSRSAEDTNLFKEMCQKFGLNWLTAPVSCLQDGGSHGCAMGLSQFMQKEWKGRELRIREITKHSFASPWNHCDAILATGMFLMDAGARAGGYGEDGAILAYNPIGWYLTEVSAKKRCLLNSWGNLTNMDNCRGVTE
jgi:hypothetical protein